MPVVPNPTVASTVITLDPELTFSITFVLPVTSKVPVTNSHHQILQTNLK